MEQEKLEQNEMMLLKSKKNLTRFQASPGTFSPGCSRGMENM